jgi:hypothetical protein
VGRQGAPMRFGERDVHGVHPHGLHAAGSRAGGAMFGGKRIVQISELSLRLLILS